MWHDSTMAKTLVRLGSEGHKDTSGSDQRTSRQSAAPFASIVTPSPNGFILPQKNCVGVKCYYSHCSPAASMARRRGCGEGKLH